MEYVGKMRLVEKNWGRVLAFELPNAELEARGGEDWGLGESLLKKRGVLEVGVFVSQRLGIV